MVDSLLRVATCTLLWSWFHSERLFVNNMCACSSGLSHLQPPLLRKEKVNAVEMFNALFCPPDMQAQPNSKTNSGAISDAELYGNCFVCCCCITSVISHAWQCLTVELECHRGKMWRLCFVVLVSIVFWFFLLMNKITHSVYVCTLISLFMWDCMCVYCRCPVLVSRNTTGMWMWLFYPLF